MYTNNKWKKHKIKNFIWKEFDSSTINSSNRWKAKLRRPAYKQRANWTLIVNYELDSKLE